eukprot:TRINITY_DN10331_c0_g1_i1.p1 TRINITY_DN10331_c0_g1~~TRINITY_DN10331_c0_g1_i1.p1  ORF type:complete len:996 (-),score=143.11 TRINITY_DN10331_c0_g1_i1:1-2583(-)
MALTDDESCARLWVWGANNDAQLGLGHTDPVSGPVELSFFRERGERIAALYGGYNYSLALTANGELYSWGYNNFGQLGLGHTNQHAAVPSHVSYFSTHGIKIKEIATGGNHVLLLTEDHRVYCWGYNKYGQLGLGNTTNYDTPQRITFFDSSRPVIAIGAGQRHSLVLTAQGEVYSFGHNHYGALALGHDGDCSVPEFVRFFEGKIVTKIIAAGYHSLFLTEDNRLWSCGYNFTGELGVGSKENSLVPKPISFFQNKAKIVSVAVGSQHTLVLLADGELYSWGYNKFGQLGLGNTLDHLLPERISFFNGCPVEQIFGGYRHTLLLTGSLTPPPSALQRAMSHLLRHGLFSDVEMIVQGAPFALHKAVLAVRSPTLLSIAQQQHRRRFTPPTDPSAMMVDSGADPSAASGQFGNSMQDVSDFFLSDKVSANAFRLLLDYVYAEQVPNYGTTVADLIQLVVCANKLNLMELERAIYLQLLRLISPTNVLQSLELSILLDFEPLKQYCLRYIAFHKSKFPTPQLKLMMKGRFDEEIIWGILDLMDDIQPPSFPHLPALVSSQAQSGSTPRSSPAPAAKAAGVIPQPSSTSAAARMVRGNRPPVQMLDEFAPQLVTSLSRDLLRLFEGSLDPDVQILCDGTTIYAHKAILGARNAWFEIAFSSGLRESQTGVIRIPGPAEQNGMSPSALRALIRYFYTARFDHISDPSDALYLLSNASLFLLSPDTITNAEAAEDHVALLAHCEQMVLEPLKVTNCLALFQQIDRLGLQGTRLRERVLSFIVENYVELATTTSLLLEIPEKAYREIQIQFNLHVLQQLQQTDVPRPLKAFLSGSAASTPLKSPRGSRRAGVSVENIVDCMDVNE